MQKLAIGPINTAGQARRWADSCATHLGIEAFSFAASTPAARRLVGPSDKRILHHRVRPAIAKRAWMAHTLRGVTHLLNESLLPLAGDWRRDSLLGELESLVRSGREVAAVFHGSDIRSPKGHMDRIRDSYFHLMSSDELARIETQTSQRRNLAVDARIPLFVSTPDLLDDLPHARWLPLSIDLDHWKPQDVPLQRKIPRVLHVPSRRNPPIKGTSFIDPALRHLAQKGIIDYVSPEFVPHVEMPYLISSADIVIDQLLIGSYGVAAVEAMSAGRLVVGGVSQAVRDLVSVPIPVVDSRPVEIGEKIQEILQNREYYQRVAARGPSYAARFHSGSASAEALWTWLRS